MEAESIVYKHTLSQYPIYLPIFYLTKFRLRLINQACIALTHTGNRFLLHNRFGKASGFGGNFKITGLQLLCKLHE